MQFNVIFTVPQSNIYTNFFDYLYSKQAWKKLIFLLPLKKTEAAIQNQIQVGKFSKCLVSC